MILSYAKIMVFLIYKRHSKLFFLFYPYPKKMSLSTVSKYFLPSGLIFCCTGRNFLPIAGNTDSTGLSTLIPPCWLVCKANGWQWFPCCPNHSVPLATIRNLLDVVQGRTHASACKYVCTNNIRIYIVPSNSVEIQYV